MRNKKEKYRGKEIDFDDCWIVGKLDDRDKFITRILELVPDDTIWAIEGVQDQSLLDFFRSFASSDEEKVALGTVWPKQRTLRVRIDSESREKLINKVPEMNLDWEIIHQHFYYEEHFYLTAYDNLDTCCTWISKRFTIQDFDSMISAGELEIIDSKEWQAENTSVDNNKSRWFYLLKLIGWILFVVLSIMVIGHIIGFFIPSFKDTSPLFPESLVKMRLMENIIETIFYAIISLGVFVGLKRINKGIYIGLINIIILLTLIYRLSIVGFLYGLFFQ
ncbi:hypothetical protein MY04_4417 [Flammeovirga sp. MY04]|uniref:hypothetical protein n=1 Tax=Flammeovirga sp. MY04 TaxID=1191459 RepID=UPI00080631CD|nr:hypothetical protein [Flammeovirga sp. MY04]ANQ51755.1 hypothetical protein MY04_4417 [Flammeovirga sp. MY04]